MSDADVVVVGGGIGGAVLALALARAGRTSVIVERDAAPPKTARPEGLWPATLATFDRLGIGDEIRRKATLPITGVEFHRVGKDGADERLCRLGDEGPKKSALPLRSTDPAMTRAIVMDAVAATGSAEILRGVEAREVSRSARGVVVRGVRAGEDVAVRGAVVVGDDGPGSRVRASLGIELPSKIFPLEFLGAAAPGAAFLRGEGRVWANPSGFRRGMFGVFLLPIPGDRVAMVIPAAFDAFDRLAGSGPESFAEAFPRFAPSAAHAARSLRFPQDFLRARRPVGHAERYVADRAAIIGDAAHPVTPLGGQGANMAVADGAALAEVLVDRLARNALSAAALAPYEKARRAANERSVSFSRRAARIVGAAKRFPPLLAFLPAAVRRVGGAEATRRRLLATFAGAFVGRPVEL